MGFTNKMPGAFSGEIQEANDKALNTSYEEGLGPFYQGSPGFKRLVDSGARFKWVVSKAVLIVVSCQLKHSAAAGGADVPTAGSGHFKDGTLVLDNDTGHYQTTVQSLRKAETQWHQAGYPNVVFRERQEFGGLFGQQQQTAWWKFW